MRALVTGGGGFLGEALVRALLERGDRVRVLARGKYPALAKLGADMVQGDIRDVVATHDACVGMDAVFHTAAKAGGWGDPQEFEAINVHGTQNVIVGCWEAKVPALVYTSSPSVVHAGGDLEGANESLPYATTFTAHYPRTKAIAEQKVREAGNETLRTVSLRPHFIWGPGDRHLLPRLLQRARAGKLRQVGSGDPKVDTIYIDNCVDAHLNAADKLLAKAPVGGKVYFVSDGEPIGVWTVANRMLAAADAPQVTKKMPAWLASAAGATLEGLHFALRLEKEPLMTRFAAQQLSHASWFDIGAARRELGYTPRVSIDQGMKLLATWCKAAKI